MLTYILVAFVAGLAGFCGGMLLQTAIVIAIERAAERKSNWPRGGNNHAWPRREQSHG